MNANCFRLASFGAIDIDDADDFLQVFKDALEDTGVTVPVRYES